MRTSSSSDLSASEKPPIPAKWWMVVPPTAHAAMPVDAVTKVVRGSRRATICLSRKDLPVPAPPVKKTLLPPKITSRSTSCCSEVSIRAVAGESDDAEGDDAEGGRSIFRLGAVAAADGPATDLLIGVGLFADADVDGAMGRFIGAGGSSALGWSAFGGGGCPLMRDLHHPMSDSGSASLSIIWMLRRTIVNVALP